MRTKGRCKSSVAGCCDIWSCNFTAERYFQGGGSGQVKTGRLFLLRNIPASEYCPVVKLIKIYQCLCDETRLRILNLLSEGPLCVCHFQEALDAPQVKISKHLNYLRTRGMVEVRRYQNWRIYELPRGRSKELELHLRCLQDCVREQAVFKADLKRLRKIAGRAKQITEACATC